MKIAFATWDHRIAPVFDVAKDIRLLTIEAGRVVEEKEETLPESPVAAKPLRLTELGVETLICGAISRPMREIVGACGILVVPFVAGDLREVIQAWLGGNLERDSFAMPGCRGRGRRGRMRGMNKEEYLMNEKKGGGMGQGGGQGRGRAGQGRGRMGGPVAGGAAGACLCPKCGHREPHERGAPCAQKQCPSCGAAMTRE